jgi:hypothetical protein
VMKRLGYIGLLLVSACSRNDLPKAVSATAGVVETNLVEVRNLADKLVSQVGGVYSHLDQLDLSVDHMDADRGGSFFAFKDNAYYVSNNDQGASYYASPNRPVDDELRREVKILTYIEPLIEKAWKPPTIRRMVFFGTKEPHSVAVMHPRMDVPSIFPPGLQFGRFEWYQRGEKSPERAKWSLQPFTDLTARWVMDISRGVKVRDVIKGVVVINVPMDELSRRHFRKQSRPMWLLSADLSVVCASPSAKEALQLPVLADPDLLRQRQENATAANQFKLSDGSQEAGVRRLAARVTKGETDFRETVKGKSYRFVVSAVPEVGFRVMGAQP